MGKSKKEELKIKNKIYYINDYLCLNELILGNESNYDLCITNLKEYIFESGNFKRRHETIDVIISEDDEDYYTLTLANLLTNLIIIKPFNRFGREFDKDFLFDATKFNSSNINSYFDKMIIHFSDCDFNMLSSIMADSISELSTIGGKSNVLVGNSMSLYDIVETVKRDERVNELVHTKIPHKMELHEIEAYVKNQVNELVDILKKDTESGLYNYLNSGTGINIKQFGQMMVNIALKPDLMGVVIPIPSDTNYFLGMRNIVDFYIDALGARKATITNHIQVKNSGYLTRKLSLAMLDIELDDSVDDCGSEHYIITNIPNESTLRRLNGKFYLNERENCLEEISEKNKSLIGKTVKLRSPITCALTNGKICKTCYSDMMSTINKDLHIGILAVLLLTNQITQKLLSSKHLLQTRSTAINWSDTFLNYFSVEKNQISPSVNKGYKLILHDENITHDEETDILTVQSLIIKPTRGEGVEITTEVPLEISQLLLKKINIYKEKDTTVIPLDCFDDDDPILFNVTIKNNELSKSLENMLELLDKNSRLGLTDIHDIFNMALKLLDDSEIKLNSSHIELILRTMIRNPEDLTQLPDFSDEDFPPYKVITVSDSIMKAPSVTRSLIFEKIKDQFENPQTYKKIMDSNVDVFF